MENEKQTQPVLITEFMPLLAQILLACIVVVPLGSLWLFCLFHGNLEGILGFGVGGPVMLFLVTGNLRVIAFPEEQLSLIHISEPTRPY